MVAHCCGGGGAAMDCKARAMAQWNAVTVDGRRLRVSSWRTAERRPRAAVAEREWRAMSCKVAVSASE